MMVIGITGGIGSGKSTVSQYIEKKGYTILDADKIARSLLDKNKPVYEALVLRYGEDVLDNKKNIDRSKVSNIVFSDENELTFLNDISHKMVDEVIKRELLSADQRGDKIIFIDAPLLFEANVDRYCNYTWLVYADQEQRIKRTIERDGRTEDNVKAIIDSQMKDEDKMSLVDDVISNSGSIEDLILRVEEVLLKYEDKF